MGRPPKYKVALSEKESGKLKEMFRKGTYNATMYRRMRILDALNRGKTYDEIREEIEVSPSTIVRIAREYFEDGFEAVFEPPHRPGCPPKLGPKAQSILVELVSSQPPEGCARWTLELLCDELNRLEVACEVSYKTVGRVLKKMDLTPV